MESRTYNDKVVGILLRKRVLQPEALETAAKESHASGQKLEAYLLEKQLVPPAEMTLALSEYLNIPPISLAHFGPDARLLEFIPRDALKRHLAVPIARMGSTLTVALADPFDIVAVDELRSLAGMEIIPLVASQNDIQEALDRLLSDASAGLDMDDVLEAQDAEIEFGSEGKEDQQSLDEMLRSAHGAPVVRMVNMMLLEAIRKNASDIHLEPMEKELRLRYRIDGMLIESPNPPKAMQGAITSRIKIMSNLDIAERRIPQDGRFRIQALGKEVDIRVSVLPILHGEKIVMRTLDKATLYPNLAALGLDKQAFEAMAYAINQPHGIILVTGPTGCGKTTTLYSCLQELNQPDVNIVTCEDPVEYELEGINQVQINSEIGLTFGTALRSVLRQEPDILLVGEIRDRETADTAVRAALTGHLVLSTLHTNDAAGAIVRLVDMGVEPFLISSSLILSQAQRLYRKLCAACKKQTTADPEVLRVNHIPADFFNGATVYRPAGCILCSGTGYKGRSAIMEVLPVDDAVRTAILRGETADVIRAMAVSNGMVALKEGGLRKVREGITSIEGALEMTGSE